MGKKKKEVFLETKFRRTILKVDTNLYTNTYSFILSQEIYLFYF